MVKPSISIQSWYTLEEILVYLTKQRLKMAPGNNRGKAKGEKKKKDEKVLLVATDITINLPDETHVVLKVRS